MAKKGSFRELGIRTAKHGTVYIIGEAFTSFLSLIIIIYLARFLLPADFGLYVIAIAFSQLLGMGGNFGIGTALRKKLPESKNMQDSNTLLSNGYFVAAIISVAIAIIGVLLSGSIANIVYHNNALTIPIILASISVFFSVIFNITMASLVGVGKVRESVYSNILYSMSQLAIIVILVSLGFGVMGAMAGYLISLILGVVLGLLLLYKKYKFILSKISKAIIKELTSFSVPLVISNIVNTGVGNFGVVLLGIFVVSSIVGNYGAALRLGNIINIFITSGTFLLLPAYAMVISHKKHKQNISSAYESSIYYTLLFLLPMVAFAIAASIPLLHLLLSKGYSSAPLYFSIIVLGLTINILGTYSGSLLIGFGHTRKFMKYQIAVAMLEFILLLLLVPYLGAYGVILSVFVIGPIISGILYTKLLTKEFSIYINYNRILRITLSSIILFAILFTVSIITYESYYSLAIDIILAVLLYPILIILSNGITEKEIAFIRDTSKRMKIINHIAKYFINYAVVLIKKIG